MPPSPQVPTSQTPPTQGQLTHGPIESTLLRLSLQMMVGILAIYLFNLADTYFIGQLGANELAAISFTFPVVFVVLQLAIGVGIGVTSVVAMAIGQGDQHRVCRLTTHGLLLAMVLVLALLTAGMLTIHPLFTLLGASAELIPLIEQYMEIWYISMGFLVLPIICNFAIRATGDTKTPAILMMCTAILNIILDPIFIFGWGVFPAMGIRGAAIATAISYFCALVMAFYFLHFREGMITFEKIRLKPLFQSWRTILAIALPASATQMLLPISNGVLTRLISEHGVEAVAAYGVGTRLEQMSLLGIFALLGVLTSFVAQNYGAQQADRVKAAYRYAIRFALVWGAGVWLLFLLTGHWIAPMFSDDPTVIHHTIQYQYWVAFSYGLFGITLISNATFNGLQLASRSTTLVSLRLFGLVIPLSLIGSYFFGVPGIFGGISLGNLLVGLVALFWVRHTMQSRL